MNVSRDCSIDWLKQIINVTFIDNYFCFWAWIKLSDFVLSSLSIFLNTEANVVTNLKPFNWVNNFISLLLNVDSVSSGCSSGLNKFKISTLKVLAERCFSFCYFSIFFLFKYFHFFVLLYKELLEPTFSAYLIVIDNFYEVFGFSAIIDFVFTVFWVFKGFWLINNYFWSCYWFSVLLSYKWLKWSFALLRSGIFFFFINLFASSNKSFLFKGFIQ